MAEKNWNVILVKYFSTIKDLDEEIEKIRLELCENSLFFPKLLFKSIDINDKNFIALDDLRLYLNNNKIPFDEHCLRRFIHNFDKDGDFSINYNEFLGIVLTKKNLNLISNVINKEENDNNELNNSIINSFNNLLKKEFNLIKNLISIADELKYSKDFTTYEAYISIVNDDKYITKDNLISYLNKNGVNLNSFEPEILMFRIDADNDGKISYDEFQEIFFPYKSNYSLNEIKYNKDYYDMLKNENNKEENKESQLPNQMNENFYSKIKNSNRIKKLEDNNNAGINGLSYDYSSGEKNQNIQNNYPSITNLYKTTNYTKDNIQNKNVDYNSTISRSNNLINTNINIYNNPYNKKYNIELNTYNNSYNPQSNFYTNQYNPQINKYNNNKYNPQINSYSTLYNPETINNEYSQNISYSQNYKNLNLDYSNNIPLNNNNNNILINQIPLNQPKNISSCPHNNISPCESCCLIEKQLSTLGLLLNDIVIQGNLIEISKENLAFCSDVNLTNLYQFFDCSQRNSISSIDISQVLKELNLFLSINDIKILFKAYDKNFDGRLDYDEFCNLFLPKKYSVAKLISERLPYENFKGFSQETKEKIISVFNTIIEGENSNDKIRNELNLIPGFNSFDLFNLIKKNFCTGIYKEDIIDFMEKNGKFLQPFETKLLIDKLDKDNDGIISYNEFMIELMPKI